MHTLVLEFMSKPIACVLGACHCGQPPHRGHASQSPCIAIAESSAHASPQPPRRNQHHAAPTGGSVLTMPNLPENSAMTYDTDPSPSTKFPRGFVSDNAAAHSSTIAHAGTSGATDTTDCTHSGSTPSTSLSPMPAPTATAGAGTVAMASTSTRSIEVAEATDAATATSSANNQTGGTRLASHQPQSAPLVGHGPPRGADSPLTCTRSASAGDEPKVPTRASVNTLTGGIAGGITHADLSVWVDSATKTAESTPTPDMRPKHPLALDEQAKVLPPHPSTLC